MNCLEFRRKALADPHARSLEQLEHAARCAECNDFLEHMQSLEAEIQEAATVPVPDGLADRIVLKTKTGRSSLYKRAALAASLLLALGIGTWSYKSLQDTQRKTLVETAAVAREDHMATMAISFVLDHEPRLLDENKRGDPEVLRQALRRLGLTLPGGEVQVRYLGKCPVPGGTGEHVVLMAPWGRVTLILVPDQPLPTRVVVAHRERTAIAAPVRGGGYIVIADSLIHAKRLEAMIL